MFYHQPVMLEETLTALLHDAEGKYIDCTLGGGGHSEEILKRLAGKGFLTGVDRDPEAIAHASNRLQAFSNFTALHTPFASIGNHFEKASVSGILADLGISSRQIDSDDRGFTFRPGVRIDCRMNPAVGIDATEWLIITPLEEVAKSLKFNSDLNASPRLAEGLKKMAKADALTSDNLLAMLENFFPKAGNHWNSLAARILQAIRMELNEELNQIEEMVDAASELLLPGGQLVFLTYHSVEDRKVKRCLQELERDEKCPLNIMPQDFKGRKASFKKTIKKPVLPQDQEIAANVRARSAKMRVYTKL